MSDRIIIEKKVDLFNKVRGLFESQSHLFPPKYRNFSTIQLKNLPSQKIKGILFEIYTEAEGTEAYKQVNQRLRDYIAKINRTITEERYVIRENVLKLLERLQEEYMKERN